MRLADNTITAIGAVALFGSLKTNSTLAHLNISRELQRTFGCRCSVCVPLSA